MSHEVPLRRRLAAECLGTFALVFAGTSAIVVDELRGVSHVGGVSDVGIALTFGLTVFALISALGDISGAHLNPAVTLGFVAAGRFPAREALPYLVSQCLGALMASALVAQLFTGSTTLGGTRPAGSVVQSFALEALLTAGLMFVILSVSTGAKEKGVTAGLAIGAVVALEALFAGPISGASMNPARSLGPAVISGQLGDLWIYLLAPVLGSGLALVACRFVREPGCCPGRTCGPKMAETTP